ARATDSAALSSAGTCGVTDWLGAEVDVDEVAGSRACSGAVVAPVPAIAARVTGGLPLSAGGRDATAQTAANIPIRAAAASAHRNQAYVRPAGENAFTSHAPTGRRGRGAAPGAPAPPRGANPSPAPPRPR